MAGQTNNVAVVAVAKDEAAYLHEWIHHHLYFGFSAIFVGLNRTTDQSKAILEKVAVKYPNVYFYELDWIDLVRPAEQSINDDIQNMAYAYFWDKILTEFPAIDYTAFFDIDEFWCPRNFDGNIADWLQNMPEFDIASFYWACQFGDQKPFAKPFENRNARFRRQLKSVINMRSARPLNRMRTHCPIFYEADKVVHCDSEGRPFRPKQCQKAETAPNHLPSAFLLHRMTRSEQEYVSNLQKGMLRSETPIKTNRSGYWRTNSNHALSLNETALSNYHLSLDKFVAECDIGEQIALAKHDILAGADDILKVNRMAILANIHHYIDALSGTYLYTDFVRLINSYENLSVAERNVLRVSAAKIKRDVPMLAAQLYRLMEQSAA